MKSSELQLRIEANPYNLPGIAGAAPMPPHDLCAARFEQEGRNAYPHGRNPYQSSTMACERWAAGWHQADALLCAREA